MNPSPALVTAWIALALAILSVVLCSCDAVQHCDVSAHYDTATGLHVETSCPLHVDQPANLPQRP